MKRICMPCQNISAISYEGAVIMISQCYALVKVYPDYCIEI